MFRTLILSLHKYFMQGNAFYNRSSGSHFYALNYTNIRAYTHWIWNIPALKTVEVRKEVIMRFPNFDNVFIWWYNELFYVCKDFHSWERPFYIKKATKNQLHFFFQNPWDFLHHFQTENGNLLLYFWGLRSRGSIILRTASLLQTSWSYSSVRNSALSHFPRTSSFLVSSQQKDVNRFMKDERWRESTMPNSTALVLHMRQRKRNFYKYFLQFLIMLHSFGQRIESAKMHLFTHVYVVVYFIRNPSNWVQKVASSSFVANCQCST